jgi:putative FmdB family regulatory protein
MPVYEYYCPKCATKFEELRPMSRADDAARCPSGHAGANRTLSMFAAVTKNAAGGYEPMPPSGGGCACGGGGCGCGGH